MKLGLVQMSMEKEVSENLDKSLRYCDLAKGSDLVIVPTANTKAEPMELFEWEIRV